MLKSGRFALQAAILPAFLSALLAGLLMPGDSRWLWISVLFITVFTAAFITTQFMLRKYYHAKLRVLHNIISKRIIVTGSNGLTRKVPDSHLQSEIMRMMNELESIDKEEIVHLKELETYRKEFLGNVSHELKTPIFTIQGYVHTLLDGGIEDQ